MIQDLRYAIRLLAKNVSFTAAVVLSIALGIGAATTVFCWMRNLLLRPLPGVAQQEEIVVLVSNQGGGSVSLPDLDDFGALEDVFVGAVATLLTPASLTVDGQPEWIDAQVVSAGFFELLGVKPVLGRTFYSDEDQKPGGNPVLVISERLWLRRFAADPDVIGKVVDLNRHSFTIVGVAPKSFRGTMTAFAFDAWAPLSMVWEVRNQDGMDTRNARGWHNLARLQPGVRVEEAQAAVSTLNAQLATEYPSSNTNIHHRVLSYADCPYGAQFIMGPVLRLLLVVSLGVLLIVAANVANLLLARASSRQKEIAIRLAAGAPRVRLIRQLLTENLVLAAVGGILGVGLATWTIDCIPLFLPDLPVNLVFDYELDAATLGIALLLTLATGVLFGLAPAAQSSRANLYDTLKEGGRTSAGSASHHRLRSVLVVAEVALALVLLVGAGLCIQGLKHAQRIDIGFRTDHVLIADMRIGMNGYDRDTGLVFYREMRERIAALPGVEEAALSSWFPLGLAGCKGAGVQVDGYELRPDENPTYEYAIISPRYFEAMRILLLAGRDFTDADNRISERVAIVNEAFAQRFWPGQEAIGRKFRSGREWRTVVGITRTGKYNQLNEPPSCFFYLPYQQGVPDLDLSFCVRTRGQPAAFAGTLRQAVREFDPGVELLRTTPLANHVSAVLFTQRMALTLLTMLGVVALLLSAMGVYAVMAYAVSERTQEFGVRMALGARPVALVKQVVMQGFALVALGVGLGLVLAIGMTRLLTGFLYGVSPFDPVTFVVVATVLCLIALLACLVPALRATRVDPMVALRAE